MKLVNYRTVACAAFLLVSATSAFAQSEAIGDPKLEAIKIQDPKTLVSEDTRSVLPWEPILERDISWKKRVWRTIDATASGNEAFADAKNGLVAVLLQGAFDGQYKVYSAVTERFTDELSREQLIALITPGKNSRGVDVSKITKYTVKEDWLYLRDQKKLIVRILGIAPLMSVVDANGQTTEQPLCWFYYTYTSEYLAKKKVTSGTYATHLSWYDMLEGRNFKSTVEKSSSPIWAAPVKAK